MSTLVNILQSTTMLYVIIAIWAISAVGLIVFVLLHSGKGTGVSEIIAGSVYGTDTGSSIVEKNLDRITVVFAVVFMLCLLIMMVLYPHSA